MKKIIIVIIIIINITVKFIDKKKLNNIFEALML